MPWVIRKRDNEWCVYKRGPDGEPTGDTLGCHETRDEAEAQIRALHANVHEGRSVAEAKQSMVVQSVIISKTVAKSKKEAVKKVPDGFKTSDIEETEQSWRFRQRDPDDFMPNSFRTKQIAPGVTLVLGKLRVAELVEGAMNAITEYDNSISDFVERVRAAFDRQMGAYYGDPEERPWVVDVFESQVVVRAGEAMFRVAFSIDDEGKIVFASRDQWEAVRLSYIAEFVSEFRGAFPDVPTYEHVDIELLTKGDPDPFYVVLPVARVGETSANGLIYDEELVAEIERQLPGLGGIRGHNFDESAFPPETHDVVGHRRVGDTLWAKFYIPPGEAREDMRRRKARGGKVGSSIFGQFAKREARANGTWRARGLKLESLDFGAATRTALNLGGAFAVVSELRTRAMEDDAMTKEQLLAELKVTDIPQALREAIIREHATQQGEENIVAELRQELDEQRTLVAELTARVAGYQRREFLSALEGKIAEKVTVEALRPVVRRAVLAEMADESDLEKADKVLAEYLDGDEYKALAKALVAELAGPNAFVGATPNENWREELAKRAADLAKTQGVLS